MLLQLFNLPKAREAADGVLQGSHEIAHASSVLYSRGVEVKPNTQTTSA